MSDTGADDAAGAPVEDLPEIGGEVLGEGDFTKSAKYPYVSKTYPFPERIGIP